MDRLRQQKFWFFFYVMLAKFFVHTARDCLLIFLVCFQQFQRMLYVLIAINLNYLFAYPDVGRTIILYKYRKIYFYRFCTADARKFLSILHTDIFQFIFQYIMCTQQSDFQISTLNSSIVAIDFKQNYSFFCSKNSVYQFYKKKHFQCVLKVLKTESVFQ